MVTILKTCCLKAFVICGLTLAAKLRRTIDRDHVRAHLTAKIAPISLDAQRRQLERLVGASLSEAPRMAYAAIALPNHTAQDYLRLRPICVGVDQRTSARDDLRLVQLRSVGKRSSKPRWHTLTFD